MVRHDTDVKHLNVTPCLVGHKPFHNDIPACYPPPILATHLLTFSDCSLSGLTVPLTPLLPSLKPAESCSPVG